MPYSKNFSSLKCQFLRTTVFQNAILKTLNVTAMNRPPLVTRKTRYDLITKYAIKFKTVYDVLFLQSVKFYFTNTVLYKISYYVFVGSYFTFILFMEYLVYTM